MNGSGQDDLPQFKDACGDDPNEYLIREHNASSGLSEMKPTLSANNMYVCADRISDCAYDGKVYSEGQWIDIGSSSVTEESGQAINDYEVCLDLDKSVPGGEWYDMDNDNLRREEVGGNLSSSQFNAMRKYASQDYWGDNPGTDRNVDVLGYWGESGWQQETTYYFKGLSGYSVEDDCGPEVEVCDDAGTSLLGGTNADPWFNAGKFDLENESTVNTGFEGPPAFPGESEAPKDPDGDGLYEDVDGDGSLDENDDPDTLFSHLSFANDHVKRFNFQVDGEAEINSLDVQDLLTEIESMNDPTWANWSCIDSSAENNPDVCTVDATDHASDGSKSLKVSNNVGSCGYAGMGREFDENPGVISVDVKEQTDSRGAGGQVLVKNSSGSYVVWEGARPSGASINNDWKTVYLDLSSSGDNFKLIFGNKDETSDCGATDHGYTLWADNLRKVIPQDNFDSSLGYGGIHNKMEDDSDQFEPGAATQSNWRKLSGPGYGSNYRFNDSVDSTPGPDSWALTNGSEKLVANDGSVYEPGKCYYRNGVQERTDTGDDTVYKTQKIFGNSYADEIVGAGVWRDPDDIASFKASFSCDLTGPDRGYGYDTDPSSVDQWRWKNTGTKNANADSKIVLGDIAWAEDDSASSLFVQEKNACGDDNKEYLIEEIGESKNSAEDSGLWGCGFDTSNYLYRGNNSEKRFFDDGEYVNAEEKGENSGRLKNDNEVCVGPSSSLNNANQGVWFDQDHSQEFCRENTLYGKEGRRWVDKDYVETYSNAVKGGIDDDLNEYLGSGQYSPVPTGVSGETNVSTIGFCVGDDADEHLITQRCRTNLCETDNSVIGASKDPDKCILEGDSVNEVTWGERKIFDQGENVTVGEEKMACFKGKWRDTWPVEFLRTDIEVPVGQQGGVGVSILNVKNSPKTFDLELRYSDPSSNVSTRTSFRETGNDSITVDVPAASSKVKEVVIRGQGADVGPDVEVTVDAESQDGSLSGDDNASIRFVNAEDRPQVTSGKEVPGLGAPQLFFFVIAATLVALTRLFYQ
jgi:hypothetical protein